MVPIVRLITRRYQFEPLFQYLSNQLTCKAIKFTGHVSVLQGPCRAQQAAPGASPTARQCCYLFSQQSPAQGIRCSIMKLRWLGRNCHHIHAHLVHVFEALAVAHEFFVSVRPLFLI